MIKTKQRELANGQKLAERSQPSSNPSQSCIATCMEMLLASQKSLLGFGHCSNVWMVSGLRAGVVMSDEAKMWVYAGIRAIRETAIDIL